MTLWTVACQAPLSMGFSRQEYQSGLPCCPPGDLPDPGLELASLRSTCIGRWAFYHEHHLGSPKENISQGLNRVSFGMGTRKRNRLVSMKCLGTGADFSYSALVYNSDSSVSWVTRPGDLHKMSLTLISSL